MYIWEVHVQQMDTNVNMLHTNVIIVDMNGNIWHSNVNHNTYLGAFHGTSLMES